MVVIDWWSCLRRSPKAKIFPRLGFSPLRFKRQVSINRYPIWGASPPTRSKPWVVKTRPISQGQTKQEATSVTRVQATIVWTYDTADSLQSKRHCIRNLTRCKKQMLSGHQVPWNRIVTTNRADLESIIFLGGVSCVTYDILYESQTAAYSPESHKHEPSEASCTSGERWRTRIIHELGRDTCTTHLPARVLL